MTTDVEGQQDAFPETLPIEVEITDPGEIMRTGMWHAWNAAAGVRRDVPAAKRSPGFAYALALIELEAAKMQAERVAKNLLAITRAGHDISTIAGVSLHGHTLVCDRLTPAEQAEQ